MTYTKTQWANDTAPAINATNLNNIETGIGDTYNVLGMNSNSWSASYTYNAGETALYNNKLYKNLTGTNTSTAPSSDTTNWLEISILSGTTKSVLNEDLITKHITNSYSTSTTDGYSANYTNTNNTYSTNETFTGKYWIDGKKIYRKVCGKTTLSSANSNPSIAHGIDLNTLDKVLSINAVAKQNGSYVYFTGASVLGDALKFCVYMNGANYTTRISWDMDYIYIITEYTKTT